MDTTQYTPSALSLEERVSLYHFLESAVEQYAGLAKTGRDPLITFAEHILCAEGAEEMIAKLYGSVSYKGRQLDIDKTTMGDLHHIIAIIRMAIDYNLPNIYSITTHKE
ncbi:hypothetical protein [Pseudomonas kurunegalensis]|uniref:hypothetical protein n=1 Tax=Pseudomonas kurunegalensis TaxID=485880 RepID=UPI00402A05FA